MEPALPGGPRLPRCYEKLSPLNVISAANQEKTGELLSPFTTGPRPLHGPLRACGEWGQR